MDRRRFLLSTAVLAAMPVLLPADRAMGQGQPDTLAAHLDALVAAGQFPGYAAAVWHDGKALSAHGGTLGAGAGAMPTTTDSIFRIASITKLITAATAMTLVEEGKIGLDDPVNSILPELADMKVIADIAGPVDDVVPSTRSITLRHLLTNTFGQGLIMRWPEDYPIQAAMAEAGIGAGATFFRGSHDEYLAAVASVPLAAQPGEGFFYNNGFDVAGVLMARLTGKSLGEAVAERVLHPLGMTSTGFVVSESERDRVATLYIPDMQTGAIAPLDDPSLALDETIPFESAAGGLASTAGDLLRFGRMLLEGGELDGVRVLSQVSVDAMMTEQLSADLKASPHASGVLGGGLTWGLGGAVSLGGGEMNLPAGVFGWNGGYGTSLFVDRTNGLVGVLLTNQVVMSALPAEPLIGFWKKVYGIAGVTPM